MENYQTIFKKQDFYVVQFLLANVMANAHEFSSPFFYHFFALF